MRKDSIFNKRKRKKKKGKEDIQVIKNIWSCIKWPSGKT